MSRSRSVKQLKRLLGTAWHKRTLSRLINHFVSWNLTKSINFQLDFKVEDVEVPEIPGAFTTMKAKGTPLFVEARHFSDPLHYAKMMGYDKPMDFKLGSDNSSTTSK